MNTKRKKTLNRIFETPTRADITFDEVSGLLEYVGAEMTCGAGSRVRFVKNGRILKIHKPHPQPALKKYAVEAIRDYLKILGVKP